MSQILREGQQVTTESSRVECAIVELLGSGGQGEVYRADLGGRQVALKWYLSGCATPRQRALLEVLIRKGPPTNRFLWPRELVAAPGIPGFGYVMALREPRFRGIADLMRRRIDPTFRALATAGFGLAHSFLHLHSEGFCYRDISFGNIFFDPCSGEVAIGDNDNVTVNGDRESGILGTPRFMAPEVVRGDSLPNTKRTCFDLPAMTKLYGTEPLFIFDPRDRSNEPVPGYHDNPLSYWPIYPRFLRDLFTRSFPDGLRSAEARVREGEWRAAMIRLRDSILYCSACGAENFYDGDALRANGGQPGACWSCGARLQLPFRLRVGRATVMLNHDTRLFPHDIDEQTPNDFSRPVAEVAAHPENPAVWGLRNLDAVKWSLCRPPDPTPVEVLPGLTLRLVSGLRINFGKLEGEVRI